MVPGHRLGFGGRRPVRSPYRRGLLHVLHVADTAFLARAPEPRARI
jgi:hypothetical protein